jgi:Putative lactococcus lactis phage r1t holin
LVIVMWTRDFWRDVVERALRTGAQVLATMLIAAGTGLFNTNWFTSLSAAGMATLLSVLTSIGGEVRKPTGNASVLVPATPPVNAGR